MARIRSKERRDRVREIADGKTNLERARYQRHCGRYRRRHRAYAAICGVMGGTTPRKREALWVRLGEVMQ